MFLFVMKNISHQKLCSTEFQLKRLMYWLIRTVLIPLCLILHFSSLSSRINKNVEREQCWRYSFLKLSTWEEFTVNRIFSCLWRIIKSFIKQKLNRKMGRSADTDFADQH